MTDKHLPPLHLDAAFSDIAASAAGSASYGTAGAIQVHRLVKRSRRQRAAALGSAGFLVLGAAGLGLSGLFRAPSPGWHLGSSQRLLLAEATMVLQLGAHHRSHPRDDHIGATVGASSTRGDDAIVGICSSWWG
ncbi:hypothetical protein ACFWGN_16610 [Oerskovia sp. NPDC060338]|uniref:hypothetical protein n=1 Tax=Oerskovia sp. NPDC060338 TaxID=3347100 RepID=UPI0036595CAE